MFVRFITWGGKGGDRDKVHKFQKLFPKNNIKKKLATCFDIIQSICSYAYGLVSGLEQLGVTAWIAPSVVQNHRMTRFSSWYMFYKPEMMNAWQLSS